MVTDKIWNALYDVQPPRIPLEAMSRIIEDCRRDPKTEEKLIQALGALLADPDSGFALWWIMIVLGEAKSEKAIPLLLECFQGEHEEDDLLHEIAVQALVRIGEKAAHAVMEWLDTEPPWVGRLYGYSVLENARDYGDQKLQAKIKEFLKRRVLIEEKKPEKESAMDPALQDLAAFEGEDVVRFVRDVVERYEWHPELSAALEIAEKRFSVSRERLLEQSWEQVCQRYVEVAFPKKDRFRENPEALLQRAQREMKWKRWRKAEDLLKKLRGLEYLWSGPAGLADLYFLQGKSEQAQSEIREALQRSHRQWDKLPEIESYKEVEALEQKADTILERDKSFPAARIRSYLYGLLTDLGVLDFQTAMQEIKKQASLPDSISDQEVFDFLRQDDRFQASEGFVALQEVESVPKLLEERERRGLKPVFRRSLSVLKAIEERRPEARYEEWEKQLDQDIRILTQGKWNLQSVRLELRKDIEGQRHAHQLLAMMRYAANDLQELGQVMQEVWNKTTRWELGGRTPEEVSQETQRPPALHLHATSFPDVGRNDPCPCGSGLKFKKCCLDKALRHAQEKPF